MNSIAVVKMLGRGILFRTKVLLNLIQAFFIIFYGYLIYQNINNIIYLIIYSSMFVLALTVFIYELTHIDLRRNIEKDRKTKIKRTIRYISWSLKACIIGLSIYQYLNKQLADLSIIFLLLSIVGLVSSIVIEIYSRYIMKYSLYIYQALSMDIEDRNFLIKKIIHASGIDEKVNGYLEDRADYSDDVLRIVLECELYDSLDKIEADNSYITIGDKRFRRHSIRRQFKKNLIKARIYYTNHKKLESLLDKINTILPKIPDEGFIHDRIKLFMFFTKNLITDKYEGLSSRKEYYAIIASLIYLADEKDLIPDSEENGLIDDIFILELAFKIVSKSIFNDKWQKVKEKKGIFKKEEKDLEFEEVKESVRELMLAYDAVCVHSKFEDLISNFIKVLNEKTFLSLDPSISKIPTIFRAVRKGGFKLEKRDALVLIRIMTGICFRKNISKNDLIPFASQMKPIIKRYDAYKANADLKKSLDLIDL